MQSVFITGTNRGLGLEFATQYLAAGWRVYAACRHPASAHKLQKLSQERTDRIELLTMDVTNSTSIARAAATLQDRVIDVLINNAGIIGKSDQRTGHVDYDSWAEVLQVNVMGPLRVTEALLEQIERSERKLIVTITSGMGSIGDNTSGGSIAYRTSKAAVNMVMRSVAIDLAPRGISSIVLNPGWVRTDMGGASAPLSAEESVGAMRKLIETIGPAQSGKFFSYDGREYPW
jgi:NAD(P)-dependent dehydrogenase (short-subunit alcohol dehydrogenase family)